MLSATMLRHHVPKDRRSINTARYQMLKNDGGVYHK